VPRSGESRDGVRPSRPRKTSVVGEFLGNGGKEIVDACVPSADRGITDCIADEVVVGDQPID
jgi:hypothetical protein